MIGGLRIQRAQKTKFRKEKDQEQFSYKKKKHQDKSTYRMIKEENSEYQYDTVYSETNK